MIIIDPFQGASGDMLVGALLDICPEKQEFSDYMSRLCPCGVEMKVERTSLSGISGMKVAFEYSGKHSHLGISELAALAADVCPDEDVREKVLGVYGIIFSAEAKVHGKPAGEIKLHELSSPDTVLEMIAFFKLLGGEKLKCRMLTLGSGTWKSAHGRIPVPAPATLEILKGVPLRMSEEPGEYVTPTAAALLKYAADFSMTDMEVVDTGYGIGTRSALRVIRAAESVFGAGGLVKVEANIDDMTPEDISALASDFMEIAREVYVLPAMMKKGRTGHLVSVICEEKDIDRISGMFFSRSSTSGIRFWNVLRNVMEREIIEFNSSLGTCRVKIMKCKNGPEKIKPEFDDLREISRKSGVSIPQAREKIIREYRDE
jgi:uncharacterized protein (TIGR00299 family) protein